MVQCPKCSNNVDQEFGMVTCPHCHAVFMIDFSGQIVYGDESETPPEEQDYQPPPPPPMDDRQDQYMEPEATDEFVEEVGDFSDDASVVAQEPIQEEAFMEEEPEPVVDYIEEPMMADQTIEDDDSVYEEEEWEPEPPPTMPSAPDTAPVDVTEFADSDESSMDDGEYLYTLQISRIDSKNLREAVYYTLTDEKLELIPDQLMKKVINGRLTIPDLHPLKAKRIVEQLQYYDIDITWKQRAVIIEDNEHEAEL